MNQNTHTDGLSDVPWPTSADRMPVPDTSMLPNGEQAPAPAAMVEPVAAVGLLKTAVHGAHDTIDRFAERAEPVVQQLGERLSAAEEAVVAKTAQLRETRDAWVESLRCTVRDNPLSAIAAAIAVGALVARIARVTR